MTKSYQNTQIQLSIEHKRGDKKPKFTFSVVAKTMLLSAAMVAALACVGTAPQKVYANVLPVNVVSSSYLAQATSINLRLAGSDRYDTAVAIAKAGWAQSDYAILAFGENFPDALAAAPLAKKYNAPILLTDSVSLTQVTKQALSDLKVRKVIIIGGTGVISQNVQESLEASGITTSRIAGNDRFETSVKIAEQLGQVSSVAIVNGNGFADALSIGTVAGLKGMPILLVDNSGELPDSVRAYLATQNIVNSYVIGGTAVIKDSLVSSLPSPTRLSGVDRYATNIAVLNQFASSFDSKAICMATGEGFADALTGTAYSIKNNLPILLLPSDSGVSTRSYIASKPTLSKVVVFGGESVVPSKIVSGFMNTATTSPQSSMQTEAQLVDQLGVAANFIKSFYAGGTLNGTYLSQLANRLVEIESRLNDPSFSHGSNLEGAIKEVDATLTGVILDKTGLKKTDNADVEYAKAKTILNSVKGKLGISTIVGSPIGNGNVVYASPITNYGQMLSKNPSSGMEKIDVQWGFHTYGSNNQTEYNLVMRAVADTKIKVEAQIESGEDGSWNAVKNYLKGTADSDETIVATRYWSSFLGLPTAQLDNILKAVSATSEIDRYIPTPVTASLGKSAYTQIFKKDGDCLALAYENQAVYDSFGYNTRIVGTANSAGGHGWCEVRVNNTWYSAEGNLSEALNRSNFTVVPETNSADL